MICDKSINLLILVRSRLWEVYTDRRMRKQ